MDEYDHKRAALEHSWKYFQIHAQQRLTMFNFFVAFATIALAAIGAAIQSGERLAYFGALMGLVVPIISFVFWQLDRRTAFLVKHGERVATTLERELFDANHRVFELEPASFDKRRLGSKVGWRRMRSYRESFQTLYGVVAVIGLAGCAFALWISPLNNDDHSVEVNPAIEDRGSEKMRESIEGVNKKADASPKTKITESRKLKIATPVEDGENGAP